MQDQVQVMGSIRFSCKKAELQHVDAEVNVFIIWLVKQSEHVSLGSNWDYDGASFL